MLDHEFLVTLY